MRDYKQEAAAKLAKVAKGICIRCTRPVGPKSKWYCNPCCDKVNAAEKARRKAFRAKNPPQSDHSHQPRVNGQYVEGTLCCAQGHAYTPDNVLWRKSRKPGKRWRECRECNRLRMERRRNNVYVEVIHRRVLNTPSA